MWLFSSRHLKVMGSVAELWAEGPVSAYHRLPGASGPPACHGQESCPHPRQPTNHRGEEAEGNLKWSQVASVGSVISGPARAAQA